MWQGRAQTTRGWVPSRTFMLPFPQKPQIMTPCDWRMATVAKGPGLSLISTLYKYRLDCDTGDSCPGWPRPRYNNNYTSQDNKTTHKCYTALIWLMTGAPGTGGQTGATLSLWALWVLWECGQPPDEHGAWYVRSRALRGKREWSWADDQDVVYNRTWLEGCDIDFVCS